MHYLPVMWHLCWGLTWENTVFRKSQRVTNARKYLAKETFSLCIIRDYHQQVAATLTSPPASFSNLSTNGTAPSQTCLLLEVHSRQRSATCISSPTTLCLLSSLRILLLYSSVETETWDAGLLSLEVRVLAIWCHFLRGLSPELHWPPHLFHVSQCPSSKFLASANMPLPFCSRSPLGRVPPTVTHLLITFIFPSYLFIFPISVTSSLNYTSSVWITLYGFCLSQKRDFPLSKIKLKMVSLITESLTTSVVSSYLSPYASIFWICCCCCQSMNLLFLSQGYCTWQTVYQALVLTTHPYPLPFSLHPPQCVFS